MLPYSHSGREQLLPLAAWPVVGAWRGEVGLVPEEEVVLTTRPASMRSIRAQILTHKQLKRLVMQIEQDILLLHGAIAWQLDQ